MTASLRTRLAARPAGATKSVFPCMLLHAAYNTALGVAILRPDGELVSSTYVTLSLWWFGTPRYAPFFEARITGARPLLAPQ